MPPFVVLLISLLVVAATATAVARMPLPDEGFSQLELNQKEAKLGFVSLASSVRRYMAQNLDIDGNYLSPGDGLDVARSVAPLYGFLPRAVSGLEWRITTGRRAGDAQVVVCLESPTAEPGDEHRLVLSHVQQKLPVGVATLGPVCGALDNDPSNARALSYWVTPDTPLAPEAPAPLP